jgi:hypothetical protein
MTFRDISEYTLFRCVKNVENVKLLHKKVGKYKNHFLTDNILQNVLLNGGYELEDRPKSFINCCASYNGKRVSTHLYFLEEMKKISTEPKLTVVKIPAIITSENDDIISLETPEKFDSEKVENFQIEWMKNSIVNVIREYEKVLKNALDEYVMQYILVRMERARNHFIPNDWKKEKKIQGEISSVFDHESYSILDSAYYEMGNRFFNSAAALWKKLNDDDFGKMFILQMDDEHELLSKI